MPKTTAYFVHQSVLDGSSDNDAAAVVVVVVVVAFVGPVLHRRMAGSWLRSPHGLSDHHHHHHQSRGVMWKRLPPPPSSTPHGVSWTNEYVDCGLGAGALLWVQMAAGVDHSMEVGECLCMEKTDEKFEKNEKQILLDNL